MTTRTDFDANEWGQLVAAPRWVVAAASAVQRDLGYRTEREVEMGLVAAAQGQTSANAFVAEVARDTVQAFASQDVVGDADFHDREAGVTAVLARVWAAVAILAAKADPTDAHAYRTWLVRITDVVIRAAKSNDFLGLGGEVVTEAERTFRERLVLTLQR